MTGRGRRRGLNALGDQSEARTGRGHGSLHGERPAIFERDHGLGGQAFDQVRIRPAGRRVERQFTALRRGCEWIRPVIDARQGQPSDLTQQSSLEPAERIACVDRKTFQLAGLGEGAQRHGLGLGDTVRLHQQGERAGLRLSRRGLDLELVRACRLPVHLDRCPRGLSEHDALDAGGARRLEVDRARGRRSASPCRRRRSAPATLVRTPSGTQGRYTSRNPMNHALSLR